jgi:hypothetical protein
MTLLSGFSYKISSFKLGSITIQILNEIKIEKNQADRLHGVHKITSRYFELHRVAWSCLKLHSYI